MVQCKKDWCKEPALLYGKRYCQAHKAEYERKRKEYNDHAASAPKCPKCGITPLFTDRAFCPDCQNEIDAQHLRVSIVSDFENAETVEELKEWMREHLPECRGHV